MNKHIIKSLLAFAAAALACTGCDVNDFNENYLDGFDPDGGITDVKTVALTLSDEDYKTIADNTTNKSLAEAAGGTASAALAAAGTNKYFASTDDAAAYIPAFLAAAYSTADDGSSARVTYKYAVDRPAILNQLAAAKDYQLKAADYRKIWGEDVNRNYVTASTLDKLSGAISAEGLEAGDYVAVSYNYAATEPSTGDEGNEGEEPETPGITSVLGSAKLNDAVEVTGYIAAVSKQGPILTDNGGSCLLYGYSATSSFVVGDIVTVKGTIASYNKGFQIAAASAEIAKIGEMESVSYPEYTELTGAAMDEILTTRTENEYAKFVKMTGKVAISGNNVNILVEGAETAQGSIYGITDEMKAAIADGETVTVYGYFLAIAGGRYLNIVVSHLNEEPQTGDVLALTSVLGSAKLNDAVEVTGYIAAVSKQGPILTDNGGSCLLYGYNATSSLVAGDVVTVKGTIASYNKGFQIAAASAEIAKIGEMEVTHPEAKVLTGADMDGILTTRTENEYAQYVQITGKVAINGNNVNILVEGAETAQGSIYGITDEMKAAIADGETVTLRGYFLAIAGNRYLNIVATSVESAAAAFYSAGTRAETTEQRYAVFQYNGSTFAAADASVHVLQPADYTAMGQRYANLEQPDKYLDKYCGSVNPYGQDGDVMNVLYRYYTGGSTVWAADQYVSDGTKWNKNLNVEETTDQFVRTNHVWTYNPSVTLYFPPVRNEPNAMAFYQAVTDWVWANVDQPMGISSKGGGFVTSYGNNEYYTGCSAYYNNVDLRPGSARSQYGGESYQGSELVAAGAAFAGDGYDNLSDDAVQELMIKRLQFVVGKALEVLYPDLRAIDGIEVLYTVHVALYSGTTVSDCNAYLRYRAVGPAQLEFVEMVAY